ncbi:M28 family peptidase [Actinoplanes utahensis]|uniref:Vacuolar membrane protease n=1 Tax=Actinoplanes utahensis TaxID=1869 RepID=A0A0A6UEF3_ACTUT|nr:M28 family peptidase [Actinoplanes utahensis]KHD73846.1 peptidase [Actinoplanes utahensis]GIF27764.1 aminopeptidase [Actinoplanes utahensis]
MRDSGLTAPPRRGLAAAVVLAVLALAGLAAVRSVQPPAARSETAPAGEFSAARAFAEVRAIAATPHPAGSAANDRVRDHLVTTLRGLGLSPEVQDTVSEQGAGLSSSAGGTGLARVRNVVTVLPGAASTGRIFLVAHYDSAQIAPGANDDGAGTAAILETARALTGGERLRNDIVLVLTDAEEACLCGAKAFVEQHPLARDGGVVLNLEARGSTGPAIMFETSEDNRRLVETYAKVPYPVGTSFAVEIYRMLPNDTDFTPFRQTPAFQGLNTAYIDGAAVYHAPTDTPEAMSRDSLQHHGDNLLALATEFGALDLTTLTRDGDATYFPVPGMLIRYPGGLVWPLAGLALVAVVALGVLVRRRVVAAIALAVLPIVVAPLLAQGLWRLLVLIRPGYDGLPIDPYRPMWYRMAVIALSAAVVLIWYALLRRRIGPAALAVGGLTWLALLGIALAAFAPGGSYLAALPALAVAVSAALAFFARPWPAVAMLTVGALVPVVILLPTVLMLFPALGMPMAGIGAFLTVLLGLALLPVLDLIHPVAAGTRGMAALRARRMGAVPGLVAAVTAVACTVTGLAVDTFDDEHPSLTHLMYALDADNGTARWLSEETTPQEWTAQYVTGGPATVDDTLPAFGAELLRTGPAPAATLPAPALTLVSETRNGDRRTMRLLLDPQRTARFTTLHVATVTPVTAATVGGRTVAIDPATGGPWGFGFVFHAPPETGVEIELTVRASGPVTFRAMDGSDDLATVPGFRARPAGVGVLGSHSSELVAVAKTYTL